MLYNYQVTNELSDKYSDEWVWNKMKLLNGEFLVVC